MMANEKPGGHGERSVAVGVVGMALHDLAAKFGGAPLEEDLRRIDAVVDSVLDGDASRLAVDVNGAFDLETALTYGLTEYRRVLDVLDQHGWSTRRCIPHGGHQFSLHIAAGLHLGGNESYPGEFQPTGGFTDDAVVRDSRVAPKDLPGIGLEGKAEFLKVLRSLHE